MRKISRTLLVARRQQDAAGIIAHRALGNALQGGRGGPPQSQAETGFAGRWAGVAPCAWLVPPALRVLALLNGLTNTPNRS